MGWKPSDRIAVGESANGTCVERVFISVVCLFGRVCFRCCAIWIVAVDASQILINSATLYTLYRSYERKEYPCAYKVDVLVLGIISYSVYRVK